MPVLNWRTREDDLKTAAAEYRLLVEGEALGYGDPDAGNMIVQGDNLEALKALLPFYAGQVKCIYIDPPYNTGSAFEHYDDNMEHTIWLSMMYSRLELLKQFLREDGAFFLQLDDNEQAYAKVICDEIFGRNNFVATISNCSTPNGRDYGFFAQTHDFIHIYCKNTQRLTMNKLPNNDISKYNRQDNIGLYYLHPLFNSNSNFHKDNRPNLYYPFYVAQKTNPEGYYNITLSPFKDSIEIYPPLSKSDGTQFVWRWGKEKAQQYLNTEIVGQKMNNGEYRIAQKMRVQDKIPRTMWVETEFTNRRGTEELQTLFGKKTFAYPKPEHLIGRIIHISTNPGDYVLDSFLGSGTTAAVAHKMGRRYIGVEMGEQAKTHCAARLKKVVEGEQGGISEAVGWKGGGGFRFFTLGEAVFDREGRIKPDISFEHLAAHIYFTETKTPMKKGKKSSTFLGVHDGTAYALLYNGILGDKSVSGGNVLTHQTLNYIMHEIDAAEEKNGGKFAYNQMVIYGEAARLTRVSLAFNNIIFKQTPYDIKVW
jgi:adenine-specific DNA-methyltransferase